MPVLADRPSRGSRIGFLGTVRLYVLFLTAVLWMASAAFAQKVVWGEDFESGCTQNCQATTYIGPNGTWSTMSTGTNGACANTWFVSCAINGNAVGACGSTCASNETLHIGNNAAGCISPNSCIICPTGDCGAVYDVGCPPATCSMCCSCQSSQTSSRAVSPIINLTGLSILTLRFKYIEGGVGAVDNALLDYYNGTAWSLLADLPKTPVADCGGLGSWTSYSITLPASANNNAGVRLGVRWLNDNDGNGTAPSIAIDDMEITVPYAPSCVGPLVNEVSSGLSGNKRYIELLVCGPACGTVDLRRWKIDDNNGGLMNGFSNLLGTSGVSAGHLRFSNVAQWAAVPTGSLIVIYNQADVNPLVPPNDPGDTSPLNKVYVLPANSTLLEGCSSSPSPTGTSLYSSGCTFGAANWSYIAPRDAGDAVQTRDPNGRYFHGISYGADAQGMNSGGIDGLRISTVDHANRVIYFNVGNERMPDSYTSAAASGNQTPGLANNSSNQDYISDLDCAILPVELLSFTGEAFGPSVRLKWSTASEHNSAWFFVERADDQGGFTLVAQVPAAGSSQQQVDYMADDRYPLEGLAYYRLREQDLDGAEMMGPLVAVNRTHTGIDVRPLEGASAVLLYSTGGTWSLVDAAGRIHLTGSGQGGTQRLDVPDGLSLLEIHCAAGHQIYRVAGGNDQALVQRVR